MAERHKFPQGGGKPIKTCFKCGQEKPLSEFYKHKQMKDGHLNKCKDCTRKDVKENREDNLERVREYDRNRPNRVERSSARNAKNKVRYSTESEFREKVLLAKKKYIDSNPEKRKAHTVVGNAIRDGKLVKEPCTRCGSTENIEAHHEDYKMPLDVTWLCKSCHSARHREINEERRKAEKE